MRLPPVAPLLQGGHAGAVAALVGPGGSDPNATCPDGLSLLELAAKLGQGPVITALIQGGADVDAADAKGNTALHTLVESWKARCAAQLVLPVVLLLQRAQRTAHRRRQPARYELG